MTKKSKALAVALLLGAGAAQGQTCSDTSFEGVAYTVCDVPAGADLRLWLTAPDGRPVASFERLRDLAAAEGREVVFAMNAGMYHADRSAVGLHIENGETQSQAVTGGGGGNFGLLPNGVFCILPDRFAVLETKTFLANPPACTHATQSGPMLVIGGELHPRFLVDSDSTYIRNGVGVSADGQTARFALSQGAVNFHTFGRFFRDVLDTPEALYLDGSISRIYAPELGLDQGGRPMGPIVGLLAD